MSSIFVFPGQGAQVVGMGAGLTSVVLGLDADIVRDICESCGCEFSVRK